MIAVTMGLAVYALESVLDPRLLPPDGVVAHEDDLVTPRPYDATLAHSQLIDDAKWIRPHGWNVVPRYQSSPAPVHFVVVVRCASADVDVVVIGPPTRRAIRFEGRILATFESPPTHRLRRSRGVGGRGGGGGGGGGGGEGR